MPSPEPKPKILIAWTIDFDAISGWLGTGHHPPNSTSDHSSGYFSATVGVPRLLRLLSTLNIADKVTWCLPGHSIETFPAQARAIEQERDVLARCIDIVKDLTGSKPRGYRAPLYQISERTISLLQEHDLLWDSSLAHHDSAPYFLPRDPEPLAQIEFSPEAKAESWMRPTPSFLDAPKSALV